MSDNALRRTREGSCGSAQALGEIGLPRGGGVSPGRRLPVVIPCFSLVMASSVTAVPVLELVETPDA